MKYNEYNENLIITTEGRKEGGSFLKNKSAITEKVYRPNFLIKRNALGSHKKMKL